jgi:hypothetical protein
MFSHGCVGCDGMTEHGQASPMGTPSICVLVAGHIGVKLSMSVFHSVGRGMIGTDDAWVVGWERR